ncbi:MAG TPA: tetraacyldisaccharide 4'-kinase [Candidatus Sulfotelmatobacter sp.]
MNPLSTVYAGVVRARNSLYERGMLRARRLQGPVISVGNLSTGGAGKTPFVILLGELLKARGIPFDVLSRGYGRATRGVLLVDPSGSAMEFGDEPLLIARRLQAPVIVGEDRYRAGSFAESKFGPQIHLLDDGFQHRALARDFDIVLVTPQDADDRLLPAGRLREPVSALRRADTIVFTAAAPPGLFHQFGKPIWRAHRNIVPQNVPTQPVVFCGIARPQNFALQLRLSGIQPLAEAFFRDHHRYTPKNIQDLLQLKQRSGAEGFVTTEKDAINLGEKLSLLQPVSVIPLQMHLDDAANAVDTMLRTVNESKRTA